MGHLIHTPSVLRVLPDFVAFWCDGDPGQETESHLYVASEDGTVRELPYRMDGDAAIPSTMTRPSVTSTPAADTVPEAREPSMR